MKCFAIKCLAIVLPLPLAWSSAVWQARVITFAVNPTQPLMDDRLRITISGLPPNQLITLSAKSEAEDHLWWHSTAVFSSGPNGTIDLCAQAPVSGLYQGVAGMGLFWSMKPDTAMMIGDHNFLRLQTGQRLSLRKLRPPTRAKCSGRQELNDVKPNQESIELRLQRRAS